MTMGTCVCASARPIAPQDFVLQLDFIQSTAQVVFTLNRLLQTAFEKNHDVQRQKRGRNELCPVTPEITCIFIVIKVNCSLLVHASHKTPFKCSSFIDLLYSGN